MANLQPSWSEWKQWLAGELCERFNELLLIGSDGVEDRVPTYRGQGWVFF